MTFKMDDSGNMEVTTVGVTQALSDVLDSKTADPSPEDTNQMIRERNLLLLSTLYDLYGEDWKDTPDWTHVSATIQSKNIPNYGDNFTPEQCERRYKSLIENGYEVGIESVTAVLKPPKRLTEAQKRLWILASTSTDIVRTSKILDEQMRLVYKEELVKIEKIGAGEYNMDPSELDLEDDIVPLEGEDEFKFESTEMEKFAAEAIQCEVMEKIVGMGDVLLLIKCCHDAVDNAVKKHASLVSYKKKSRSTESVPVKPDNILECNKSTIVKNDSSEEHPKSAKLTVADTLSEREKEDTKRATANLITKSPEETLPDIPEKELPPSPQKTSKPSTRANSRDRTPESALKNEFVEPTTKQNENNDDTESANVSQTSNKETNGGDGESTLQISKDADKDSISVDSSVPDASVSRTKKSPVVNEESNSANKPDCIKMDDSDKLETVAKNIEFIEVVDSQSTIGESSQSSTIEITLDEPEEAPKSKKQTSKKGSSSTPGCTSPVSSQTSSQLATPEPDQPASETERQRKTPSRQISSSEINPAPVLRSRRGATPTKANSVEKENTKETTSQVNNSSTQPIEEEEDAFETPRSTPESPESKSDLDSNLENRPKQPKVYTAKPPSPLSHVDPKLFEELNDEEEDEELAAIDNSVNKSKIEKTSPAKTYLRRGRTVSSENASENNDENSHSKRTTRRHVLQDENDETVDGAGNNDDGSPSKRLTRSSLKLHDAANDEGETVTHTESEKAASESSFSGREKKSRQSKTSLRAKRLFDEKQRLYGDGDMEELPDGKRVTRARAKTSTTLPDKKSKPSSVVDGEVASEVEPTPTRATRSRASTATHTTIPESAASVPTFTDDEDYKAFRKSTLNLLEKITGHDTATALQKHFADDPSKIIKLQMDFQTIKQRLESGKIRSLTSFHRDLSLLLLNTLFAHPNSSSIKDAIINFHKWLKSCSEEVKGSRISLPLKTDNSDVESLESHDDARSETASKSAAGAGGRRKRKRSASETSEELSTENKRRVTRTSASSSYQQANRKPKHPISPDIVSANRVRH